MSDENGVGVRRATLRELNTKMRNSLVVGVVIAKQAHRVFAGSGVGGDGGARGVWNLTVRDSETEYANVSCWGRSEFVSRLDSSVEVGNVVEVRRARIEMRRCDDAGEQWRPAVTLAYNLVVRERGGGDVIVHECQSASESALYAHLVRLPTKPACGAMRLSDVRSSSAVGRHVDVLAAVRWVGATRSAAVREVVLVDASLSTVSLVVWGESLCLRAASWRCGTALFVTDALVRFSSFRGGNELSLTSRSVITVDVDAAREVRLLRRALASAPAPASALAPPPSLIACLDALGSWMRDAMPPPEPFSCRRAFDLAVGESMPASGRVYFPVTLYAFVLQLDLDGYTKITTWICDACGRPRPHGESASSSCLSDGCGGLVRCLFDVPMRLADHTGSLERARLSGLNAEHSLGCTIAQFSAMDADQKERLKWKFLLTRCKICALVFKTQNGLEPFVSVLSCEIADPQQVDNNLPLF